MNGNKPFLLRPATKDYLWGGSRLKDEYGKTTDIYPLAETWECSTHPDGQSIVASGPDEGKTLGEVLRVHPEYLGSHPLQTMGGRPELPILIKLIDARENLSVQVHPGDEYARARENSLGKTEMWYVLSAQKGASLVCGFNQDVTASRLKNALEKGTIEKYLNRVSVHKDDLFYIETGTVHSLGSGIIVVEIQESSNLTYRLYDYGRLDKKGNKRELHIDKALDVINMSFSAGPRQPMRVLRYKRGCVGELLIRCKYFQVERLMINSEDCRELPEVRTGRNSFHALLCTEGSGSLFSEGFRLDFCKGHCIFVPAESVVLKLFGKVQLLDVSC